ncbi:hypothetical protein K491DRAFT_100020 [Lophiostoma macrostomum CBS 122681]|uniref:Uncharacterized protein n=1 Tax=Lophiostoma macrostomum CBS 122681 TaxID=1314788 RepID=A0A6A6SUM9_9PLEO|nr:hypothetical protein K491DRAFT_100020 [Lophiostoma macrostomum CBS 122681]
MAHALRARAAGAIHLSTVALIGIVLGVVIVGLFVALMILLVRAHRTQIRWEKDMEERGIAIIQSQAQESNSKAVTRPRAVLKRNSILPFNNKSGWGTLPSVETINPPEPPSIPPHHVPSTPEGRTKPRRLSWPFSSRRASGKAVQLKKIRVPILSTVIESPKPSPQVPVLSSSLRVPPSPNKSEGRPSSDQSLLQHHPAFRNTRQEGDAKESGREQQNAVRRSLTAKPAPRSELRIRPNRSKSVVEIPVCAKNGVLPRLPRPSLHARSASLCSQSSGNAPDAPVPPLPLEVARIKSQERRRSLLSRSPSRFSISSHESGRSSILATQSSPILPGSSSMRVQKVAKRDWRNSMIVGPRPLRDTLTLHGRNPRSQTSIKSTAAHLSMGSPITAVQSRAESQSSSVTNSSSMQSIKLNTADTVTFNKIASPGSSPMTVRSYTPKCKSGSHVTAYGSPEERPKPPISVREYSGNVAGPMRQLSRASTLASSTRSSNGNPFQWDPTPLSSSGKPSALKGSPSARKGHRRKNSVRISLDPTILGPPSRTPSPSGMKDIQEESPTGTSEKRSSIGLGFTNTRSLPRPPSTSVFAPDVKFAATSIRASLTPSSPTLSMANYDQGPSRGTRNPSTLNHNRVSTGSIFTIPTFPSPCHDTVYSSSIISPPPTFAIQRPSNEYEVEDRDAFDPSSHFEMMLPDINIHSSPERPLLTEEYDPERPSLILQTPASGPNVRNFSSPFSTILEEPSPTSVDQVTGYEQMSTSDSPPCSPKTLRPNLHMPFSQPTYPQYSIQHSTIPEESPLETIDPAILSKDASSTLNSVYKPNFGIPTGSCSGITSMPMPASPGTAMSMLEPLLEAAFPSSAPADVQAGHEQPLTPAESSPSSVYTSPSPSDSPLPSPLPPRSPRPRNEQLPTPALDFANMPTLAPGLRGPRESPGQPLRTSIAKLRRLNSDAKKGGKDKAGRGERRYLRLGREDSIALPGDESFFDELEDEEEEEEGEDSESTFDEVKGRHLVGDLLDWEEEATMLDLADTNAPTLTATPTQKSFDEQDTPRQEQAKFSMPSSHVPSSPKVDHDDTSVIRSSSIWEDGERFWHSTPPAPRTRNSSAINHTMTITSPNKPKNTFLPLSSSPLSTPFSTNTKASRKRDFDVAKDESLTMVENAYTSVGGTSPTGRKIAGSPDSRASRYRRRREALGVGTPNVRIQVQAPSTGGGNGTPGSLYDAQGFFREG